MLHFAYLLRYEMLLHWTFKSYDIGYIYNINGHQVSYWHQRLWLKLMFPWLTLHSLLWLPLHHWHIYMENGCRLLYSCYMTFNNQHAMSCCMRCWKAQCFHKVKMTYIRTHWALKANLSQVTIIQSTPLPGETPAPSTVNIPAEFKQKLFRRTWRMLCLISNVVHCKLSCRSESEYSPQWLRHWRLIIKR